MKKNNKRYKETKEKITINRPGRSSDKRSSASAKFVARRSASVKEIKSQIPKSLNPRPPKK